MAGGGERRSELRRHQLMRELMNTSWGLFTVFLIVTFVGNYELYLLSMC